MAPDSSRTLRLQRWNHALWPRLRLCNGLSGYSEGPYFPSILDAAWSPEVTGLPEYFVVFFQDGPVYYAFDYQNGIEREPSIRLIDVEMDQWLEVANSFDDFLSRLEVTTET